MTGMIEVSQSIEVIGFLNQQTSSSNRDPTSFVVAAAEKIDDTQLI